MKKIEIFNWYISDKNIQKSNTAGSASSCFEHTTKTNNHYIEIINKALIILSNHKKSDNKKFENSIYIERIELDDNQLKKFIEFYKSNPILKPFYSLSLNFLNGEFQKYVFTNGVRYRSPEISRVSNAFQIIKDVSDYVSMKPIDNEIDDYIKLIFRNVKVLEFNEFSDIKFDLEDEMLEVLDKNAV